MRSDELLSALSEVDIDLILELYENKKQDRKHIERINKRTVWLLIASVFVIMLVGCMFQFVFCFQKTDVEETIMIQQSSIEDLSSIDSKQLVCETTYVSVSRVFVNGKEYYPAGPLVMEQYDLPSNTEIKESDIGEYIGKATSTQNVNDAEEIKAYLYSKMQGGDTIIILEMNGNYEFYVVGY